jgi:hypothetical protein
VSEVHKLVNPIWSKDELPDQQKESYYCMNLQKKNRWIKLIVVIMWDNIAINLVQNFMEYPSLKVKCIHR